MMNAMDRNKIKHAGFRIFRQRRIYPVTGAAGGTGIENQIWELSESGSWCKYQDYESYAALKRAWDELMKDSMNIGDPAWGFINPSLPGEEGAC